MELMRTILSPMFCVLVYKPDYRRRSRYGVNLSHFSWRVANNSSFVYTISISDPRSTFICYGHFVAQIVDGRVYLTLFYIVLGSVHPTLTVTTTLVGSATTTMETTTITMVAGTREICLTMMKTTFGQYAKLVHLLMMAIIPLTICSQRFHSFTG